MKVARSESHSRRRFDSVWIPAWFRVPFGRILATCFEGIPGLGLGPLLSFSSLILVVAVGTPVARRPYRDQNFNFSRSCPFQNRSALCRIGVILLNLVPKSMRITKTDDPCNIGLFGFHYGITKPCTVGLESCSESILINTPEGDIRHSGRWLVDKCLGRSWLQLNELPPRSCQK